MHASIGGRCFVESGMMKEVRNSRRSSSFPYQSGGIVPSRSALAAGDKLVKVSWSWMVPWPQGEAAAARKCCLLKRRRLVSIADWSSSESQTMSSSELRERKS